MIAGSQRHIYLLRLLLSVERIVRLAVRAGNRSGCIVSDFVAAIHIGIPADKFIMIGICNGCAQI